MGREPKISLKQLKTHIVENTWLDRGIMNFGWGNGYVLIPRDHPLYEKQWNEIEINTHYSITFSEKVDLELMLNCGLVMDDLDMWMIGFDTVHFRDTLESWPKERVQLEADSLLSKIKVGDFRLIEQEEEEEL